MNQCWAIKKEYENKLNAIKMRMLRYVSDKTRKDKIRNKYIKEDVGIAQINNKERKSIDMVGTCTTQM